jgi:plasmid stability protein
MANLTIVIDDDLLKRARIRALEQGTSVNALLRTYLTSFADSGAEAAARREVAELARSSPATSGKNGRSWTRDELYDRAGA